MNENILEVKNVSHAYEKYSILNNISFHLSPGEIVTLIGASGTGKTTLFKLLTGLIPFQQGCIYLLGKELSKGSDQIAYMMQEDLLLPWRTVLRNMTLVGELGKNRQTLQNLEKESLRILNEVGLASYENHYPHQLSGGMRQRVALGRVLLQNRPLLLLDEPFGALDVILREQMYGLLRQIQQKYGTTMLMVTHDFRDAMALSDRILFLNNGNIQQSWRITPEVREEAIALRKLTQEIRNSFENEAAATSFSLQLP